jgi:hypothetical protein
MVPWEHPPGRTDALNPPQVVDVAGFGLPMEGALMLLSKTQQSAFLLWIRSAYSSYVLEYLGLSRESSSSACTVEPLCRSQNSFCER